MGIHQSLKSRLGKIRYYLLPFLIFFSQSCTNSEKPVLIPSGSYHYLCYNSDGKNVVEGWFTIVEDSIDYLSGEWHFNPVGNPKNIGPQVGDGILTGGYQGDTLWIELNPQYRDNNVQLIGVLRNAVYEGIWAWISYPGITAEGNFIATYQ